MDGVVVCIGVPTPPGFEVEEILAVGESLLVLVVVFGSASVGVGGRGGPARGVCHAELSAGLRKAGAGMDPEEMVDDERAGALLAGGDGVEVVSVFVGWSAEGGLEMCWALDVTGVERVAHVRCKKRSMGARHTRKPASP
jgi:hypothetical protein